MDLYEIFAGNDSWQTRQLLEHAAGLSDDQLDQPVDGIIKVLPWERPERNLRELLDRIVTTKELWTAALAGRDMPSTENRSPSERTPAGMLARLDRVDAEFNALLKDVRTRGAWDDAFVDALCEPPEMFTFGGMFAHVITFNTYRRLTALDVLRRSGVKVDGFGCPMEYESAMSPVAK